MKYLLSLILTLLVFVPGVAHNLQVSEPLLYSEQGQSFAVLNVQWDHAWKNDRNHDAVWLFFKFLLGDNGYVHAKVNGSGHEITVIHSDPMLQLDFHVPKDSVGVFLRPKSNYRGHINATVKIVLNNESFAKVNKRNAHFSAYGMEMVYIPEGGYTIGDPDPNAMAFGSLYTSDTDGSFKSLIQVNSENQTFEVGQSDGQIYYQSENGYAGDQTGTIPASFPKGVDPFYIMKYEPMQGEYASFLNSLNIDQTHQRTNFGGRNYYKQRGSIYFDGENYLAKNPKVPCNFLSWDDQMAFADWAGLRPMTEFEFTKAARGPGVPKASEFPWGTNSKTEMQRVISPTGQPMMLNGMDESKLTDETKELFGASYYWVMDLSGSLWERVVSIGHPIGRAFKGNEGDGILTWYGFTTDENWPKGIKEEGGFGYRGGGFYGPGRDYHEFNPYSPVAYRFYGGWAGGTRKEAYGVRFVRGVKK